MLRRRADRGAGQRHQAGRPVPEAVPVVHAQLRPPLLCLQLPPRPVQVHEGVAEIAGPEAGRGGRAGAHHQHVHGRDLRLVRERVQQQHGHAGAGPDVRLVGRRALHRQEVVRLHGRRGRQPLHHVPHFLQCQQRP